MSILITIPTGTDTEELIANLREEDRQEIIMQGDDPAACIRSSIAASEIYFCLKDSDTGHLLYMFGVTGSMLAERRGVWSVGTEELKKHLKAFLRVNLACLRLLFSQIPGCSVLWNMIPDSADYATYRKWAVNHLQSRFLPEPVTFDETGATFLIHEIRREDIIWQPVQQ